MARDAAGAEWGRYFKEKSRRKTRRLRRQRSTPCIYLMHRAKPGVEWFGQNQTEVKIGMTARSPQHRVDALYRDGFKLYAYWFRPADTLEPPEKEILSLMRNVFGLPSMGREYFFARDVQDAYWLIVDILNERGVKHID